MKIKLIFSCILLVTSAHLLSFQKSSKALSGTAKSNAISLGSLLTKRKLELQYPDCMGCKINAVIKKRTGLKALLNKGILKPGFTHSASLAQLYDWVEEHYEDTIKETSFDSIDQIAHAARFLHYCEQAIFPNFHCAPGGGSLIYAIPEDRPSHHRDPSDGISLINSIYKTELIQKSNISLEKTDKLLLLTETIIILEMNQREIEKRFHKISKLVWNNDFTYYYQRMKKHD